MKEIVKEKGSVYCNEGAWEALHKSIAELSPSKIFILVDTNTQSNCLPYFVEKSGLESFELITIPAGELYKTIASCMEVWKKLSEMHGDRQSLLINLGGGMVTDLGGFVASTYQRGITFINVPTSLLAMVDASVGGKNGVDLGLLKNQIGVINNPECVIIDTHFLNSLPNNELRSGQAEIIKHGLIDSENYLAQSFNLEISDTLATENLIWKSILIKNNIITQDPTEKGIRKTLNYGHTLGHAIESYCLLNSGKESLLHGEAIAIGLILETFISCELLEFPTESFRQYAALITKNYKTPAFSKEDVMQIIKLLIHDKKNTHGRIQFVLLSKIGKPKTNCTVPNELIFKAFNFYNASYSN